MSYQREGDYQPDYGRRWRKRRRYQLRLHPMCRICLDHGVVTAATVVDHVEPHRGNYNKFWLGALQSLCKQCHDKLKQQQELKGFHNAVGLDGFPTDRNHPFWKQRLTGE